MAQDGPIRAEGIDRAAIERERWQLTFCSCASQKKVLLTQREAELGVGDQDIVRWSSEILEAAFRGASHHDHIAPKR